MFDRDIRTLHPDISNDYKSYIQHLPEKQRSQLTESSIHYMENTNGQHAVSFEVAKSPLIGISDAIWAHVLLYDKDNKRIQAIKYKTGTSLRL